VGCEGRAPGEGVGGGWESVFIFDSIDKIYRILGGLAGAGGNGARVWRVSTPPLTCAYGRRKR